MLDNMNLGSLEVPQERKSAMFFATLFWREPDLQIYNRAQCLVYVMSTSSATVGMANTCRTRVRYEFREMS